MAASQVVVRACAWSVGREAVSSLTDLVRVQKAGVRHPRRKPCTSELWLFLILSYSVTSYCHLLVTYRPLWCLQTVLIIFFFIRMAVN